MAIPGWPKLSSSFFKPGRTGGKGGREGWGGGRVGLEGWSQGPHSRGPVPALQHLACASPLSPTLSYQDFLPGPADVTSCGNPPLAMLPCPLHPVLGTGLAPPTPVPQTLTTYTIHPELQSQAGGKRTPPWLCCSLRSPVVTGPLLERWHILVISSFSR